MLLSIEANYGLFWNTFLHYFFVGITKADFI
jgi:hypothetical protein